MKADKIANAVGEAREAYIVDADAPVKRKRRVWPALTAAAACLAVAVGTFALWSGSRRGERLRLPGLPDNVKVYEVDRAPDGGRNKALVPLTEEEIFTDWAAAIFRGAVTDVQNIVIDIDGLEQARAILTVEVTRTLRGDLNPGDTARILCQGPIGADGVRVEDNDVVGSARVGDEGIFMTEVYDRDSVISANGAELCLADLAPYGFPDDVRFAFLQTPEGLAFDRGTYGRIADAGTLEDVEDYIAERIAEKG